MSFRTRVLAACAASFLALSTAQAAEPLKTSALSLDTGGYTNSWQFVLEGQHHYEFGDQGGALRAVSLPVCLSSLSACLPS